MPRGHNNDSREWKALRLAILKRDNYTCTSCGLHDATGKQLHIDHIVPKKAGGTDDPENLRTLCARENQKKGAKAGMDRVTWFNPRWQEYWQ